MRCAVITGGAGGLGRALTALLLQRGWQVAILDLPGPELERSVAANVRVYPCDLTDHTAVGRVCSQVEADHETIDLVIYNAGITHIGLFSETALAAHRTVFEVNYFGAVHVAAALLLAVRRAQGAHLAISSVAGFAPLYSRTAYSASKHALEGFFRTLREEEREFGVGVTIAAPSFVATNIGAPERKDDGVARPGSASDGIDYMSPQQAAITILDGVEARRAFVPVGRVARLAALVSRFAPAFYARQMMKRIRRDRG